MKRNKIMFVIAIVAILAVLFVACDEGTQPEHTHTYGAWTVTTAPTEDTAGSATRACACGDVQTTTVAKLSDTSVWTVDASQDATHTSKGFKVYKSAYGTVTVTIEKTTGHTYGAWTLTKNPTTTETGTAKRSCVCGYEEETPVAALTDASVWTTATSQDPTHESKGFVQYTSVYGTVLVEVAAGQHTYNNWTLKTAPTLTETGLALKTCVCGHYEEETVAVLTDTTVWAKQHTDATHQAAGSDVYTSVYGAVTIVIPQIEHSFTGEYRVNADGTHSRKCTGCDAYSTAVEHDFSKKVIDDAHKATDADCTNAATYYYSCECGAVSTELTFENGTALGHNYSEFKVTKEPTCTETGIAESVCKTCKETQTNIIAANGHKYTQYAPIEFEYGDGDFVETYYQHSPKCEVCGYVNESKTEKHTYDTKRIHVNAGGYAYKVCDKCDYIDEEESLGNISSWTVKESVTADYNKAGYTIYTKDAYEYRKEFAKLVAPYDGKTYYSYNIYINDSGVFAIETAWSSAQITFNENGVGTGTAYPFRGTTTIKMVNAETGEINWEYGTDNFKGYVNFETGVIIRTRYGLFDDVLMMIPTSMTVTAKDVTGSTWTDSMAFAYNAICNLNETHTFNVFVYDEKVYFGAQFVDADGNAVAAGACSEASYVKVLDAGGNKVQAFAQKNGGLTFTDGKEGTYTSVDNILKLDGVGGFVLNGKSGFYTAAEGASYGYDAYVGADVATATEYYQITLGENNTCTVVKPEATLSFGGEGVVDVENITANVNIVTPLPTPVREGYVFNGWQLNGEGDAVLTFKATEAGNEYAFVAQWTKKTTVTVKDLKDEDKAQYSTVYVGVGNPFVGVLPAYDENTYRDGYKFAGWYLDNGDGVLNTEDDTDTPLGDADTAKIEGADYVIFAVWNWQGNVTFAEQTGYTFVYDATNGYWKSNNKGKDNTSATMEITVESGVAVISFDYLVSSAESDKFTIWYGPDWKSIVVSGKNNEWQTLTTTIDFNKVEKDSNKKVRITYAKDSSLFDGDDTAYIRNLTINGVAMTAQSSLGKNAGTYTATDSDDIKVSAGGVVTINNNDYVYTTISEKVIGVMVGDVYKEYTLDTAAKTYTVDEPKVTVAYNYNGNGTNTSAQVGKYSNQTLASAPTADGFIFRGWYTDEALTKAASETFVASEDVTFYAKWDAAITLTYNYLNGGANKDVVVNLYANDTVETLKAVDFDWEGKKFAGWFTKDGSADGDWGVEFVADTTLTKSTTVYAKWVTPHALMGDYAYGANLDPSESGIVSETDTLRNGSSYSLTIDVEGNVTGCVKGVVKDYDPATGTFYVLSNNSKYYGGYNAETKTIYVDYRANMTDAYHDIKFAAAQIDDEVPSATFNNAWDNGKTKLVRITYKNSESVESYRYILIYGKSIYSVTNWNATNASGVAVTDFTKIYSDAYLLTIVCGETTIELGKKNNNFVALDGYQGTYTTIDGTITLDGVGGVTLADNTVGTYTKAADGAVYTFDVKTAKIAYKLTVDKEARTWQIAENALKVSYVNDLKAINEDTAYVGIQFTLPSGDAVAVEGYIFRGWYDNAEFSGNAVTEVTLTENATYYAKYDAAVSLTFDYSGYEYETGKTTQVVAGKYINDTLGNVIPTVASDVRHEGKVFAGWFFKDGENWGDQVSSSTALTQEVVTIYAKWIEAFAAYGSYKGWEVWSSSQAYVRSALSIDALGKLSGSKNGTIVDYNDETGYCKISSGSSKYYAYYDKVNGIFVYADSSNTDNFGTDAYFYFKGANAVTMDKTNMISWNSNKTRLIPFVVDGVAKTVFIDSDKVYGNVKVYDLVGNEVDVTAKLNTNGTTIVIKQGDTLIAMYRHENGAFTVLESDGKAGTYTSDDAYGDIVLNGFGTLTVNGKSVSYLIDGDKVTFVVDNAMRVITLSDNNTYTKTQDGYQGEYTLPDASKLTLDGHGNAGTGTYVVNGTKITIYNGETSTTYGLDVEGKNLLGKSVFANRKFLLGTNSSRYIQFTDGVDIEGRIEVGFTGFYVEFANGVLSGNTLTVTVTAQGGNMGNVGKTITFTVSGNTLTVSECPGLNTNLTSDYNLKVGTVYTCEGFSL